MQSDRQSLDLRTRVISITFVSFCFLCLILTFPNCEPLGAPQSSKPMASFLNEFSVESEDIEISDLNDFSPLFLTTRWNYGMGEFPLPKALSSTSAPTREHPEVGMDEFKLELASEVFDSQKMPILVGNSAYSTFMRKDLPEIKKSLIENGVRIEVVSFDDDKSAFSEIINLASITQGFLWSPVEMTVFLNSDSAASAPFILSSSGIEALDLTFEDYAKKNLHRMNLKPGYYKIIFAP